jgi:hypothetical protein
MGQIRDQESFLNAVLGTLSISVAPQGQSEAWLLPGRPLFNHVKIYGDERTIDRIAQFINETVLKVPVNA